MSRRGGGRRPESGSEQHASASFVQRGGGRGTRGSAGGRSGGFQSPAPSSVSGRGQTPTPVAVQVSSSRTAQCASASSSASDPLLGAAQYPASSSSTDALSKELKKLTLQSPPVSSKAVKFPSRPSFGTEGNKCLVKANHFLVQLADTELHHYDVSITPEVVSKSLNREVISQLVDMYRESHLGKRTPAYDGRKSIYTAGPLPFSSKEFVINLPDKKDQPGRARREREFKVAIKFASKPDIHHLRQFLHGKQHDAPQETIQVLDVVLREYPSKNYCVVGRSFFSSKLGPIGELGDGIEYWKGYYQSLRPTQMGLSLNIDVSARPFYESVWVTEFVVKYFNFNDLSRPLSEQNRLKLKKALKGVRVEISYRSCVRSYKITGLSRFPLSETMFSLDDEGTSMSVLEYFHKKYNIPLKYGHLPGIQAGSDSKPIYLPLELCKIVKGQRYTKKLNDRQVTAMLRATCQRPPDREKTINEMLKKNDFKNDRLVKDEFGLDLNEELTMVDARVLRPPRLKYHESGREHDVDPRVGQWNMINKKMINGATVHYWTCVSFSSRLRRDMVFRFCDELVAMCESKGMAFNRQPLLPINSAHSARIESALANIHKQSIDALGEASRSGKRLQLLIIILPDETGSYGKIKRICETELGIVSQCCQPRNAQRLSKQYFENVSLKINVKVGGRNSVLFDAVQRRIPLVTDVPTIILGADVTHPPPGEDSSPSIAAVVASMDWPEITKYRGLVSAQAHREEMIQDLYKFTQDPKRGLVHSGMIRELLISFRRSTGQKPFRIIFYRDGVSEGQFSQVLLFEMDAIRKACASLEENYLPPVTFVVVQKRHHTRFFPTDRSPTDKSGNILPGTVVDTKICHPTEFDFYLNSHAGIQGTSRPTHYHVLYDENRFTADALQTLTNKLCYTYARCTRSVSIVPPAYYAHLAAFRARYYIEGIEVTDSGSAGAGRGTREHTAEVRPLPSIKDNVKDVMFYC